MFSAYAAQATELHRRIMGNIRWRLAGYRARCPPATNEAWYPALGGLERCGWLIQQWLERAELSDASLYICDSTCRNASTILESWYRTGGRWTELMRQVVECVSGNFITLLPGRNWTEDTQRQLACCCNKTSLFSSSNRTVYLFIPCIWLVQRCSAFNVRFIALGHPRCVVTP
jgi:hypothetical protein